MVINVERVKAKERYNACTVGEWFAKLQALCETTGDNPFEVFQIYVDYGLRLHAAEPGYVHHDAPIHKGDMTVAISKAKLARRMIEAGVAKEIAPDALVPVHWRTPHEFHQSLFDLWIVRSNLEKVCQSLGDADAPWPDHDTNAANPTPPRTARALAARLNGRVHRQEELKRFLDEMDRVLEAGGYCWNRDNIAVTKADFCKVAKKQYANLNRFKDRTITNDLSKLGARFQPGSRNRKGNVLERLFLSPKLT